MLTNEQTARFKTEFKKAYLTGWTDGVCGRRDDDAFDFDARLSKIIWYCMYGTDEGWFDSATAKIMDNLRHEYGEPDDFRTIAEGAEGLEK